MMSLTCKMGKPCPHRADCAEKLAVRKSVWTKVHLPPEPRSTPALAGALGGGACRCLLKLDCYLGNLKLHSPSCQCAFKKTMPGAKGLVSDSARTSSDSSFAQLYPFLGFAILSASSLSQANSIARPSLVTRFLGCGRYVGHSLRGLHNSGSIRRKP